MNSFLQKKYYSIALERGQSRTDFSNTFSGKVDEKQIKFDSYI